ncbi:MAG TPA: hypothetical protein VM537_22395 [Anaerolineae bacterium]|nr:hypothetical protein [Anaerolineae bacterium]
MPSERFFYRPVPPNYEAIGQGLGYGIESGVNNYYNEKDRQRQRTREDVADQRAAIEFNTWTADQDIVMGPRPAQPGVTPLNFGQPGMAQQGGPGNVLTRDIGPSALGADPSLMPGRTPIMSRAAEAPPIRQYDDISGPGFEAFRENRESKARRLGGEEADMRQRAAMAERMNERQWAAEDAAIEQSSIQGALIGRGVKPEQAPGDALLLGGKYADFNDLYPQPGASRATTDRGLLTVAQATAIVDQYSIITEDDGFGTQIEKGHRLTPGERLRAIQALARGEPTGIPAFDDPRSYGEQNQELMGEMFGGEFDPFGQGRGAEITPYDPEYIKNIRAALQEYPREQWEEILLSGNADPTLLKIILGR